MKAEPETQLAFDYKDSDGDRCHREKTLVTIDNVERLQVQGTRT